MRVTVVGDLVVDVVVAPRAVVVRDADTPARVMVAGGGSGANTAVWMARAGVDVALVARVGDDMAGRLLAEDLRAAGVEPLLAVDPEAPTGGIVVLVERDGRRTMLTDRGASALLSVDDLPAFTAPGHLHLSGYTLLGERSRAAGLEALGRAKAAGFTVSVTPGTVGPLRQVGVEAFLRWTEGVDLCLANREEAAALVGDDDQPEALARTLSRRCPEAVVTLGAGGAVWASAEDVVTLPAHDVSVVDTTGAGDAFAAGLLTARLAGASRHEALAAGLALAAEAVSAPGGRPPTRR